MAQQRPSPQPEVAFGKLFLDSGAHSLYNKHIAKVGQHGYGFYKTQEFYDYLDAYAAFVKEHADTIDYYVSVDTIFNPEISWKTQLYLEKKHGLKPVPVVHYGEDVKWIRKYMDHAKETGLDLIGIGGVGQKVRKERYYAWADAVFNMVCDQPGRLPLVRTHGFAMTSWDLLFRYPWWSVDSASWVKSSAFGSIYVPHMRGGKFVFTEAPYAISVSSGSPSASDQGQHLDTLAPRERSIVLQWLQEIGVPLGSPNYKGDDPDRRGVRNHYQPRVRANLLFFEYMVDALPKYPWAFQKKAERISLFD
jgi:hypothetical protein